MEEAALHAAAGWVSRGRSARGNVSEGSEAWEPPGRFDEYTLVRLVGRGGMGRVYEAHDALLDRRVAIKFLVRDLDLAAHERLLVEARAAARLQHPNVVAVHRIGEIEGRPFIVSELLRGESLDRLARPLSSERVREIGVALARGLAAAHRRGVLHRDIKPANAILTDDGNPKLVDFGLAKLAADSSSPAPDAPASGRPADDPVAPPRVPEPSDVEHTLVPDDDPPAAWAGGLRSPGEPGLTRAGAVLGTPYYMAPEVACGEPASARSDVFSLGALLFDLASGAPPNRGLPVKLAAHQQAPAIALMSSDLAPDLGAVIDRCLALAPRQRYASGQELWDALDALGGERRGPEPPAGNPYRGLLPFEAAQRALFFGRGPDVRAVVERLRTEPFVLVTGESGVGKSSLCRAGALPELEGGSSEAGPRWRSLVMLRPMWRTERHGCVTPPIVLTHSRTSPSPSTSWVSRAMQKKFEPYCMTDERS